jgi:hypothetical protein
MGEGSAACSRSAPLDAGSAAPLTAHDLVALFEGALSFTVLALTFYLSGLLLHVGHSHDSARALSSLAESRARRSVVQAKDLDGKCTKIDVGLEMLNSSQSATVEYKAKRPLRAACLRKNE